METKITRDQQKLLNFVEKTLKALQKQVLDLTEIAVPAQNWKALRSKILGITNDFRRDFEEELAKNYQIKYSPEVSYEDVVVVNNADHQKNLVVQVKKGAGNGNTTT